VLTATEREKDVSRPRARKIWWLSKFRQVSSCAHLFILLPLKRKSPRGRRADPPLILLSDAAGVKRVFGARKILLGEVTTAAMELHARAERKYFPWRRRRFFFFRKGKIIFRCARRLFFHFLYYHPCLYPALHSRCNLCIFCINIYSWKSFHTRPFA